VHKSAAKPLARRQGSSPRWAQLPYAIVLAGVAAGLAWMSLAAHHVKEGMLVVAGALLVAAASRLALPERRAGLLVARGRVLDVTALASLGACLLIIVLVLPPSS
jgi:hypothetical protein